MRLWFEDEPTPTKSMEVVSEGLYQTPGFVKLKETKMDMNNAENVRKYQKAVVLQEASPYLEEEIDKMIKSCQTEVYVRIRKGTLTPEDALSYWMEMYSYARLNTRLKDAAAPAADVTETRRITNGEA